MIFESLIDTKLQKDVKTYIQNNIHDIRDVNEIINVEQLKNYENGLSLKFDDIQQNLNNWKIVSQLTLNLYNEFETYKNLPFLSLGIDNSTLINKCYQNNSTATIRPDESNVIEVLYQYTLWTLVFKYCDNVRNYQRRFHDKIKCLKCAVCDVEVDTSELECSVCGETVINSINPKLLEQSNKDTNENQINIASGNSTDINVVEFSELKYKHCDNDNEKLFDRMKDCDKICQESKNSVVEVNEMWNCWWGGCKKRNYGNNKYCKFCGVDKTANQNRGELIDIFKDGMTDKIWICNKCQFFNKRCNFRCLACEGFRYTIDDYEIIEEKEIKIFNNNWKCDKCGYMNQFDFLSCSACSQTKTKPCKICSERIPAIKEFCSNCNPEWYCWYRLCGNINYGNGKYCKDCGIDRNAIDMYGVPIDRFINNKLDKIWICTHCFVVNDIDSLCKTRYCPGRKCKICLQCKSVYRWNDDYCYKCYKCL